MKSLFNFYLDDGLKQQATEKLNRLLGEESKGQLAAFLRTLLSQFVNTPDDRVDKQMLKDVKNEYVYSTTKNKRSKL